MAMTGMGAWRRGAIGRGLRRCALGGALVASLWAPLAAGALDGPAIGALLTGARLAYDDGTAQSFAADGPTLFFARAGSESIGHWAVRGGQYCPVWPPSGHWACYDVTQDGPAVSFVAADGSATTGRLAP